MRQIEKRTKQEESLSIRSKVFNLNSHDNHSERIQQLCPLLISLLARDRCIFY